MPPIRSRAARVTIALALVVTACTADENDAAPPPVQPIDFDWGELDPADQRLVTIMAEIDDTFRNRADHIWSDDYRVDQTPIAFAYRTRDGTIPKMYVFHHPDGESLPGATKLPLDDSLGVGDVYRIDPPASVTDLAVSVPFDFEADIGGTSSMLFFLLEDDPFLSTASWDFARLIVHETFHRYQLIDARWAQTPPDRTNYPRDAENAALALLEDRVLSAMIDADETAEILLRLRQFLSIRRARTEAFELGNLAMVQELAEGTARYVENRYDEVNGRPGRWDTAPDEELSLDWLTFGRFYDTGSQMAWALDHLGVNWKDPVAQGTALTAIALDRTGDRGAAGLIEDAKVEFGYDHLVESAEAADLKNPEQASQPGAFGEFELVQCLAEQGLPVDTVIDPTDAINALVIQIDIFDPEVSAALDSCGIGIMAGTPPMSSGDAGLDEETLVACLREAGIDIQPDGLADLDPGDATVRSALDGCGMKNP